MMERLGAIIAVLVPLTLGFCLDGSVAGVPERLSQEESAPIGQSGGQENPQFTTTTAPEGTSLPFFSILFGRDYMSAEGTWVPSRKCSRPRCFLPQTTVIECRRELNVCIESTVYLFPATGGITMHDIEVHPIVRWDEVEIVTEPHDLYCVRSVLSINRAQEAVTRSWTLRKQEPVCTDEAPTHWTLTDPRGQQ